MRHCRPSFFFAVAMLVAGAQSSAQTQSNTTPQKQDESQQEALPKLIKSPIVPFAAEARQKDLEGKMVELSIVVDADGRVSSAKPVSGPPELFQAAIDSVKQWQYEPPSHAPVERTVSMSWGSPKECPGQVYDRGEVEVSGRLLNKDGKVVGMCESDEYAVPQYPMEDIKAGVSGKSVLSVALDAQGAVKEIRVVKSLSPQLDEAALKAVRTWKFKLIDGNPDDRPKDYQVEIIFRATCTPRS
jgi:TonB family protein